jgi:hypothetical protein
MDSDSTDSDYTNSDIMDYWDELCPICGMCPGGGPDHLYVESAEECIVDIMENIQSQQLNLDLDEDQLRDELEKIVPLFEGSGISAYEEEVLNGSITDGPYFPFQSNKWHGWEAVAIGIFDKAKVSSKSSKLSLSSGNETKSSDGYVSYMQFLILFIYSVSSLPLVS